MVPDDAAGTYLEGEIMKKKLAVVMSIVMLTGILAACGKSNTDSTEATTETAQESTEASTEASTDTPTSVTETDPESYLSAIHAEDFLTLGDYKGITVTLTRQEVTDDDVNSYIERALANNPNSTPVTDRAVQDGDTANIDFTGSIDGTEFDGGSATGYDLTIGSGAMIDGFEDGIVGMEIGGTKDITVTFPESYPAEELAGKEAVFAITVNSIAIEETPELTDEYVAGLGIEDVATVDEYKVYMRSLLEQQAQTSYDSELENDVIETVAANCTFEEMPEKLVDRMYTARSTNLSMYAQMYGMELADFLYQYYGVSTTDPDATILEMSKTTAERYVMMQAIADSEGLTITDEELNEALTEDATTNGYESAEEYKAAIDMEAYMEYLMVQKTINYLVENAVVTAE